MGNLKVALLLEMPTEMVVLVAREDLIEPRIQGHLEQNAYMESEQMLPLVEDQRMVEDLVVHWLLEENVVHQGSCSERMLEGHYSMYHSEHLVEACLGYYQKGEMLHLDVHQVEVHQGEAQLNYWTNLRK